MTTGVETIDGNVFATHHWTVRPVTFNHFILELQNVEKP